MLFVFNIVPAFPLDGGRIARALIWWRTGDRNRATRATGRSGQAFALRGRPLGVVGVRHRRHLHRPAHDDARLLPLPGRRRGGRAGGARPAHPEPHGGGHHGPRARDDPSQRDAARRAGAVLPALPLAMVRGGRPGAPFPRRSARLRASTRRSPPGALRCPWWMCSRTTCTCASTKPNRSNRCSGQTASGVSARWSQSIATACCKAWSRWPRSVKRCEWQSERKTVRAPERYRVLPAATPFHSQPTSESHASTRRIDHWGRPRGPACRPRGRRNRRQCRDHEQGPPGALTLGGRRRRHQRGDQRRRRLALARVRHRQGLGLPRRPGRDRSDVLRGTEGGHGPGAHGRDLPPQRGGQAGPARVRRRVDEAHRLRGRHHRAGDAARALRAADAAPRDGRTLRGVVHHLAAEGRRRPLLRGDRARGPQRADGGVHGQERDPRLRRRRPGVQADDQRPDRHRRRDRDGLPRGRAADGHGDGPVPPHLPAWRRASSSPRARAARVRTC